MNKTLEQILESSRTYTSEGRVADYIPELAKANREEIGILSLQQRAIIMQGTGINRSRFRAS